MRRKQFRFLANFRPDWDEMDIIPTADVPDKIQYAALLTPEVQFPEAQFSGNWTSGESRAAYWILSGTSAVGMMSISSQSGRKFARKRNCFRLITRTPLIG